MPGRTAGWCDISDCREEIAHHWNGKFVFEIALFDHDTRLDNECSFKPRWNDPAGRGDVPSDRVIGLTVTGSNGDRTRAAFVVDHPIGDKHRLLQAMIQAIGNLRVIDRILRCVLEGHGVGEEITVASGVSIDLFVQVPVTADLVDPIGGQV